MKRQDLNALQLPDSPGVYFFRDEQNAILYIGKATSLKDRVASYFNKEIIETRGLRIVTMVTVAKTVTYEKTDSVLEALLLESSLIKKYQPPYNAREKDNKSYVCLVITKEEFPRVLVMRIRDYEKRFTKKDTLSVHGPFTSISQMQEMMKIIRKMFPYRDTCEVNQGKKCFNAGIGLCPGSCIGQIKRTEYVKHVRNIQRLFDGKKKDILKTLEKDMRGYAKRQEFEKAIQARNTLFALQHIEDTRLIKKEELLSFKDKSFRIEAYDVAHISGTHRVGVMVCIEGKEKEKSSYRKFKLEENINDDYEGLRQVLCRRFSHTEWKLPDLIVIDGGKAHKETAEKTLIGLGIHVPCVSVVKDQRHKAKDILGDKVHVDYHKKEILLANLEAHRFAISYHKSLRNKVI